MYELSYLQTAKAHDAIAVKRPMLPLEDDSGESGFRSLLSRWLAPDRSSSSGGSALSDPRNLNVGLRRRVAVISVLFLCVVGAVTWYLVNLGQRRLIEIKALDVAEVVARLSTSSRSVYAERVVNKLQHDRIGYASENYAHEPGNVPLPAQFLKFVGEHASKDNGGLYHYRPLSKWNLAQSQGLADSFQRWAWQQLEAQDRSEPTGPIDWEPVWRIETLNGVNTLRYMRADPAASATCVECHNRLEQRPETVAMRLADGVSTGKMWKIHQLMGALEINIPLDRVEARAEEHNRLTFTVVLGLLLSGMLCIGFLVIADVARARTLTRQLAWRASHDPLTGLLNRSQFEHSLGYLLGLAQTEDSTHAIMFLDLDQFKVVNDTCGHMAGDSLLLQLGATLKDNIRGTDTLARLGGDEFGVLLMQCNESKAYEIAEKLRQAITDFRFVWNQKVFEIGVSIGVVVISRESANTGELMSAADLACYAAKEAGGNSVHVLKPSDSEVSRRRGDMEWAGRITSALQENRMYLMVQPAKALRGNLAISEYQEVLLRMNDESGKPVPTEALIGAAERYNLMPGKLDRWVVQTACRLVSEGKIAADPQRIVAINLSGSSLSDEAFLKFVHQQINSFRIEPTAICFEVTETAAIRNLSKAIHFLKSLKSIGCRFALDDFGSGLCSFAYLKSLPVDFLKIDGAFVRNLVDSPFDRAMVDSIAKIGRVLGIPTIAEWVENDETLRELTLLGIDYAQGYGVAKPHRVG